LNSPGTRNALSAALVTGLNGHLREALSRDDVRSIVLTGEGPAFCAGADLKNRGLAGDASAGNSLADVLGLMRHCDKPVLVAMNGAAFGGGIGLVAAADIAIGVQGAKMSFSEVRVGAVPAVISVVVLPKLGEHLAMRLYLTGARFTAEDAVRYGLLHQAVPASDLEAAIQAELDAIHRGGPNALRETKRLVREVPRLSERDAFRYATQKSIEMFSSDEAAEGMAAFAEKRPPRWVAEED
jgi:methylglutaconyl-CoA hydratase